VRLHVLHSFNKTITFFGNLRTQKFNKAGGLFKHFSNKQKAKGATAGYMVIDPAFARDYNSADESKPGFIGSRGMNEPLAITNVVIIALTAYASYRGFVNSPFLNQFIFYNRAILADRQYYRLLSSGFLHADWTHLIFNMYSLYSFGSAVELLFGRVTFLAIYLAGIVGGNVLAIVLHRKQTYRALGASGGVCGVIFACIFLLPGTSVELFLLPIPIPAHIYAVGFMLFSYYGIHTQAGNIGHDAHLGGAIIGLLTATALHPSIVPQNPLLYATVMLLAVSLMVLLYMQQRAHHSNRRWIRNDTDEQ
jgi:membrane associated rhomboid family serine protease